MLFIAPNNPDIGFTCDLHVNNMLLCLVLKPGPPQMKNLISNRICVYRLSSSLRLRFPLSSDVLLAFLTSVIGRIKLRGSSHPLIHGVRSIPPLLPLVVCLSTGLALIAARGCKRA